MDRPSGETLARCVIGEQWILEKSCGTSVWAELDPRPRHRPPGVAVHTPW